MLTKTMKKNMGFLPKKFKKLSKQHSLLKAALISSAALPFAGCIDGGDSNNNAPGAGLTQSGILNPVADVSIKEGGLITLTPTATSPTGRPLTFSYSGYMTSATKQTAIGDAGVYNVTVSVNDGVASDSLTIKVIVYSGNITRQAEHLVRRISFGMTPTLYNEVDALGAQGFLDQQLDPASIDDTAFTRRIADTTVTTRTELRALMLMHMIYSKRQLLEVMTWFWDNHFNTDINSLRGNQAILDARNNMELSENNGIRAEALGNFRNLLGASAKSPTMVLYLNSAQNRKADSNENYARELLELHTMGVNGGYTDLDVEAGAEIFTGWHLDRTTLAFTFNSNQHNTDAQTYLGNNISSGGAEQGEQVLDILSRHTATAQFICGKLITLFVNDTPPPALVNRCASTFQAAAGDPDQISQVLRIILTSVEFNDSVNNLAKVKTPVEFVTSVARGLEGESDGSRLTNHVANIGMRVYENALPTGWSEVGADWISSGLLLERLKAVENMLRANNISNLQTDLLTYFRSNGATTSDTIVDFMIQRLLGETPTATLKQPLVTFLDGTNGFNLTDSDAVRRLRQTLELVMSYPQFQYQ